MAANCSKAFSSAEITPAALTREGKRLDCCDVLKSKAYIFKEGEHFLCIRQSQGSSSARGIPGIAHVVGGVIRDEEAQVGIVQDSRNADQPCSASRHNRHVLPAV